MAAPDHIAADDAPAVGYVRSHDLGVERTPGDAGMAAEVAHIQVVGSSVRVILKLNETSETVEAELTREAFRKLALKKGERVFVRPRNIRVFMDDYQI